jgi:hypothetical protein
MRIAGLGNMIRALLCLVIFFFALRKDARLGIATITVPVFALGVSAPYMIRDRLISMFPLSAKLLNGLLLIIAVLALMFSRKGQLDPTWFRITLAALISIYLGCYFWIFSDERLQKEN